MIRIAIADDHPLVIDGLQHVLKSCPDMEVTGSYLNGKLLLEGIAAIRPDVLLLDIQMPGQTGDELAKIIHHKYPDINMLALTNLDNVYFIKTMLHHGVKGYVLKTTNGETLQEAIRTVYNGEHYLPEVIKDKLLQDSLSNKSKSAGDSKLSRREKEVLQYLASDLTSQEIAEKLFISKSTVDHHRLSLLTKFEVKNTAAMIRKAMRMGLVE